MSYNSCQSVTLTTIDARCDNSIGGIKRILIAQKDDVSAITVDTSDVTSSTYDQVTAITMASGKKFEEWQFRKETGSYTSTMTADNKIGNRYFTTEVALQFSRAEAQKRIAIQSAINANSVVIIEDMYGKFVVLGVDNEVTITAAVMQSGTANADLSGFTLTMQEVSESMPRFAAMDSDAIDALKVAAA